MERNIRDMQALANKHGVNLRSHIKTHKIPELARLQVKTGAVGIAVAKLAEAEVMADAGIKDIQIANIIVGADKIKRLRRLHRRCRISVAVDSVENVKELSAAFAGSGKPLSVFIKVNTGLDRCGFDSLPEIVKFLQAVQCLPGIKVVGLMTHAGHAYAAGSRREVAAIGKSEGSTLVEYAQQLRKHGIVLPVLSVGSTPTARYAVRVRGVTELRVGNYIFNDMTQVALGTVPLNRCALTVLATVISTPSSERAIIDAGSKALGLDQGAHGRELLTGYGKIIGGGGVLARLSEEHGVIEKVSRRFRVGQKVRIIPNHACSVMNLFNFAYLVDGDTVIRQLRITARGMMT
jgi:D-serine deaminase-like pyridoxal phosphate-dependent protein